MVVVGGGGGLMPTSTPTSLTWYQDADGDGYGNSSDSTQSDTQPSGYVADNTDCNDSDPNVWRTVTLYVDVDGDGYGTGDGQSMCIGDTLPTSYASKGGDCNDSNSLVHPGATELCDGIDNNCNDQIDEGYPDLDQDGKADCVDNDIDGDSVNNSVDCDPLDVTKWQTLTGYIDNDHDNYGTGPLLEVCSGESLPVGYASNDDDCDDNNPAVHPGAVEIVNGIDDNCDGKTDILDGSLHHLGDDHYSGSVNSQLNMSTEGITYNRSFTVNMTQPFTKATLSITHRGVEKDNPIKINGKVVCSEWDSPSDGSMGTTTISFDISILKAGANTISITSLKEGDFWSTDYDDFEFTNIYITLSK